MLALKDRVAVVTGASRGIGRCLAEALAEHGADLVLVSRREEHLAETRRACELAGRRVVCVGADLGRAGAEDVVLDAVRSAFGRVDVVISNAAISPAVTRAEKISRPEWEEIFAVNVTGAFFLVQALARLMKEQGGGSIVMVTSVGARSAIFGLAAYCATKAALEQLVRCLAAEWAPVGIRVNAVAPAFVETDMNRDLRERGGRFCRDALDRTPLGRFARPEEIAGAVLYLASDQASYVTGHTLAVDGGWTTR